MTRHLPMLLKRRRQNKQVSRNVAGLVLLFGTLASVISGCGSKESNTETAQVPYEEEYQEEVSTGQESGNDTEVSAFHENEEYEAEEAEKEAEISYEVRDVSAVVLTEEAVDSALRPRRGVNEVIWGWEKRRKGTAMCPAAGNRNPILPIFAV